MADTMNLARINLNLLVAFKILYEEKSVTKAAERLSVTQAAMSNTLRLLRDLFSDPLFIRVSRGISPTKKAEQLIKPVMHALDEVESIFYEKEFNPKESSQTFTLALSDHGEFMILPRLIERLKQCAPNIRLNIIRFQPKKDQDFFDTHELSGAIGFYPNKSPHLKREALFSETGICVTSDAKLKKTAKMSLKKYLSSQHVALAYAERDQITFIDKILLSQKLNRDVLIRVPHIITAFSTIKHCELIGTFPAKLSKFLAAQYDLTLVKAPFDIPSCDVELIWPKQLDHDPANVWLRQIIKSCSDELESSTTSAHLD